VTVLRTPNVQPWAVQVQTEPVREVEVPAAVDAEDARGLGGFLKRVTPVMLDELEQNLRSTAFFGYSVQWEESHAAVTRLHDLCAADCVARGLDALAVSINASGTAVAACYGRNDHTDWCVHGGAVCVWYLSRRDLAADKPHTCWETTGCATALAWHPLVPTLLCSGGFNGAVTVLDMASADGAEPAACASEAGDVAHREPVTAIAWLQRPPANTAAFAVATPASAEAHVVSASQDGSLIVWQVVPAKAREGGRLVPAAIYRTPRGVGVTSVAVNPDNAQVRSMVRAQ
jgi:WD repeat-containing protein 34